MDSTTFDDFRIQRDADWSELGQLLDGLESRRGKPTSAREAERLGELYRRAVSHLSIIRTRPEEKRLERSINRLVVRAHSQIYRPPPSQAGPKTLAYLTSGFPAAVRGHIPEIGVAASVLFAGIGLGWGAVTINPDTFYAVVPLEESRSPGASVQSLRESLSSGRDASNTELATFSGQLWQHNSRVALFSFGLGALAGIPTVILILLNGLMLGAMSKVFVDAGLAVEWFAWLIGHGVTELGALVLAAAAGLIFGRAVVSPGSLTRGKALATAGKRALSLALGAVFMLFFAALLEGFFRQTSASTSTRYIVGALTGLCWLVYFYFAPRPQSDPESLSRR
ncbi:MAG: stage II sporulation protein M [Planctomycetota bacterium]|nr:stage II sporulation protein M [Planctomycetota bacterium]MDG2142218.1 stage II sporulation protein M [Planctomycetota bacterium]